MGWFGRRLYAGVVLATAGALLLAATVVGYGLAYLAPGGGPAGATWQAGGAPGLGGAGPIRPGTSTGLPTRLRIPAIGVDAPLEALGLTSTGALDTPKDYNRPGWYAEGTVPGDIGPAVIAGHVDSKYTPAVFFRLAQLRPGEEVLVARGGGWVTFRVAAVSRYAKHQFPTAEVYGSTPDPQLRLITCGGTFDTALRSYADNIVAYAVAA
ncbi:MAG TPA: class F sortase [Pilimelia sp.]|nr:class F sortase [Pilimelia sp.]